MACAPHGWYTIYNQSPPVPVVLPRFRSPARGNARRADPPPVPSFEETRVTARKTGRRPVRSHLDLYLHTRGKLQFHQRVDRFGRRRVDVEDTLEGAELELLAGFLVDESRAVDRKNLLVRGKGHRAAHDGARALHGLHNLLGRLVHEIVIE